MRNVTYLGLYTTRPDAGPAVLHRANESGLWQAWRAEDGSYVIQALDVRKKPWGNFFSLAADDFFYALTVLPAEDTAAGRGYFLRSDSPHLLDVWFDQAQAAQTQGEQQVGELGLLPEEAEILSFAEIFGGVSPSGGSGRKAGDPEDLQPVPEAPRDLIPIAEPDFPPNGPAALDPLSPEEPISPEERIARLEARMRVRFAELLVQVDDPTQTAVDADLQKLLQEEADFSWQQKYMFAEFGMALRRKGKKQLAFMAHLRAFELAPEDAHILFNLARSEYELGHISRAKEYLAQSLAVLPNFAPALNFLSFLNGQERP
ncbi:MAG: tetratricopeptide repeat protein [Desulfovibrio sp.]|nr:tetratricopeptide repeat protein [Desulfovibrio sp.]